MEEYSLFTSNNSFMKPKNQLWTYELPLGIRSQLVYVLFRKNWRNSVHNSRSFSTFTVSSDHRVVSSTIKLSLHSSKPCKPHHMKCYDWRKVAADKGQAFSLEVYNPFVPSVMLRLLKTRWKIPMTPSSPALRRSSRKCFHQNRKLIKTKHKFLLLSL